MIPIAALGGAMDAAGFWQNLATMLGTAAVWAQHRARPERDAVEELTHRLRHPLRHAAAHPLRALHRQWTRRP